MDLIKSLLRAIFLWGWAPYYWATWAPASILYYALDMGIIGGLLFVVSLVILILNIFNVRCPFPHVQQPPSRLDNI